MKELDNKLVEEAKMLGINASMYNLLSPKEREKALRKEVERKRVEMKNGQ